MPESPRKLINIDDSSKKENVEMSAEVNVAKPDQKDDFPTNENIPNLQFSPMSETSNIDNEVAPNIQSPESEVESSVEMSGISKNEYLKDSTPETDNQKNLVSDSASPEKQQVTRLYFDTPTSLALNSNHAIDKECASSVIIPSEEQSFIRIDSLISSTLAFSAFGVSSDDCSSVAQEQTTAADPKVPLSSQSSYSKIASMEESDTSSDAKDEKSLALQNSSISSDIDEGINVSLFELSLTEIHKEMSSSLAPISLVTSNLEDSVLTATLSEQHSTELSKETPTLSSIFSEINNQEISIPTIIISEEPSAKLEEIPSTPSSTTEITNNEVTIPYMIPSEQPSEPEEIQIFPSTFSSEAANTESSFPLTVPPEVSTGLHAEVPVSVPSTSEIVNSERSIPSTMSSEKSIGLQAVTPVSVPSTLEATNEECSSFFSAAVPDSETSTSPTATSEVVAQVPNSEDQTEIIAQRLLKQITIMKTIFKRLKEMETSLDAEYRKCHCNAKQMSTVTKSPYCKQCPVSAKMHLHAQDTRFTISQLFVHVQRICNWFQFLENVDDKFKVHMTDIENLQKDVSALLKRFNLDNW